MKLEKTAAAVAFVLCSTLATTASADLGAKCCPFSDARLKTNVENLLDSTDTLTKIHGVRFKWKESGREDIGVVAQNVKEVYPELVHEKDGMLTVDYEKLVAPLIESVRELNQRIEALEKAQAAH
ncbi:MULTISPECIES: tail fiber domain-containing protein [Pseudomonas]|uniref:tail fiber domain-containing protein n=1 Tax=Pseudomonas TaxID=286 RepID=UPI0018AA73E0|nr:tail fiber domain-containing protein [Pseudomonas guariconensis]MBF8743135.1 tail fiber domain-containing protein [Pseudomonas guariconensis]MBF8752656.1 tail fiber domain-containing protein [Pseudomonas guariconensis]